MMIQLALSYWELCWCFLSLRSFPLNSIPCPYNHRRKDQWMVYCEDTKRSAGQQILTKIYKKKQNQGCPNSICRLLQLILTIKSQVTMLPYDARSFPQVVVFDVRWLCSRIKPYNVSNVDGQKAYTKNLRPSQCRISLYHTWPWTFFSGWNGLTWSSIRHCGSSTLGVHSSRVSYDYWHHPELHRADSVRRLARPPA